jgi:hypothetical protein
MWSQRVTDQPESDKMAHVHGWFHVMGVVLVSADG